MTMLRLRTGLLVLICLVALGAVLAAWPAPAAAQTTEADVYVAQAILAFDAKKYDEALGYLKDALALDPKSAEANYYTGLVLMAQQKPGEAVAVLEKARDAAPGDLAVLYQLGLAYFTQKEYRKAEGPLEQVFKTAPQTDGVGYYLGFIRYQRGDYKGALETLRAGASSDPDLQQLTKVYASLTLAQLGQPEQAKAEAEQALRVTGATAVPTSTFDRLRQTVGAKAAEERRFHADVRFGILYDTNPAVLPLPSHEPNAETARLLRPADSFGELYGVNLSYTFLKTGPWEANVGFSLLRINYNDEPHFNTTNVLFSIGGSYRGAFRGMPWQLSAEYSYDDTSLAGSAFLDRHTGSAAFTLVENAGNLSALQVRYQDKDFSQIPADLVKGTLGSPNPAGVAASQFTADQASAVNWLFGVVHVFRFEADKHFIKVGFQYDAEKADGRNYSYDGYRFLTGGQYTVPWYAIRARYDFDLHQRYYRNKHSKLNDDAYVFNFQFCHRCPYTREREDTEQNHLITIELPLPYNLTLSLQQLWQTVSSNIDLLEFSRSVSTLSMTWRY